MQDSGSALAPGDPAPQFVVLQSGVKLFPDLKFLTSLEHP